VRGQERVGQAEQVGKCIAAVDAAGGRKLGHCAAAGAGAVVVGGVEVGGDEGGRIGVKGAALEERAGEEAVAGVAGWEGKRSPEAAAEERDPCLKSSDRRERLLQVRHRPGHVGFLLLPRFGDGAGCICNAGKKTAIGSSP